MELSCLGALLLFLSVANYWVARSVLYPPFAFCFLWLFILAIYQSGLVALYPLNGETIFLLGAGAVAFSAGGAFAKLVPKRLIALKLKLWPPIPKRASFLKKLLTLFVIAGTLTVAGNTVRIGMQGLNGGLLASARQATVDAYMGGAQSFSLLAYIPILSIFSCTLFLIEKPDKWFWWTAFAAGVTAIFTTSRGLVLQIFCVLIAVHLVRSQRTRFVPALRFIRLPAISILVLLTALIFVNKNTSEFEGNASGAIVTWGLNYFVLPTAGLNYVLHNAPYYGTAPFHTFKIFLEAGSAIGMWSYTAPPALDSFVFVPLPTNVYTGYKFYFTDFGLLGCLVAVGVIAFLQTILYRRSLAGSEFSLYLFAITTFPLVMFVFDDQYSEFGQLLIAIVFG